MTHVPALVSDLFVTAENIPASHSQHVALYIFGPLPKFGISLSL